MIRPEMSEDDIAAYLYNHNLQYVPDPTYTSIVDGKNFSTHYVARSSSIYGDTVSKFDVVASIDLNATEADSPETLYEWVDSLESAIYLGALFNASNPARGLVAQLNSLTMVQGVSNSVFSSTTDISWYSCIISRTTISPFVFLLAAFAGFILLVTLFYWIYLLVHLGSLALPGMSHRRDAGPRNLKPVPDSILSWMLQATRENALGNR